MSLASRSVWLVTPNCRPHQRLPQFQRRKTLQHTTRNRSRSLPEVWVRVKPPAEFSLSNLTSASRLNYDKQGPLQSPQNGEQEKEQDYAPAEDCARSGACALSGGGYRRFGWRLRGFWR